MGIKLFDDDGDENLSDVEINEQFAKRYEHNKKREDLQRFEEMKKKGLVDDSDSDTESSSESDMDDDENNLKSSKSDAKFISGLLKLKNNDPVLREKDAKLFESSSEDDEYEDGGERGERKEKRKEKRKKPKYLKDVIAQQLIEKGANFEEEEEEEEEEERESGERVNSYAEEQEELRREVLDAMAEAEREDGVEGDDFLKQRDDDDSEGEDDDEDEEVKKMWDEYFGEDEKLDENGKFLKGFLVNKAWIDSDKGKNKVIEDDIVGYSEDEEEIEKQDYYEREVNFRHEQYNVSDRVEGHSRRVEGSVRKETNARKQQRERKKERMAQAEMERQEEVKRLKNLKRKEIQEKLNKIKEIAGFDDGSIPFNEEDLEEDFDPVKFDEKLKNAYGDDYYEKEDVDPDFGNVSESDLEKPDFDKEDELLGLPKDWDVIKSNDGFLVEREKMKKDKLVNGSDDEVIDEGKKKRKRKKSAIKEALDKELEDELYKLDYEDSIGDLKTRFKYKEVKPAKYGLKAADILMLDEKELNQYVSLKKLATYREQEWRVPQMKKQMLFQGLLNNKANQNRRKRMDGDGGDDRKSGKEPIEVVKEQGEGQSVDENNLSRAVRRRRRMKEKKLPVSRLIAYGKIPSSSTNKKKS